MAEDQQFYRQLLQSTAPDGSQTIREVVSPTLLDAAGAQAAEAQAGRTFTGFVSPDALPASAAAPPTPPPPPEPAGPALPSDVAPTGGAAPYAPAAPPVWPMLVGPTAAAVGSTALAYGFPEAGIPLKAAQAGIAGLGMAGGEALREHVAGEPLSPWEIGKAGATGVGTEVASQMLLPVVAPAARYIAGRTGAALDALGELGPVVTTKNALGKAADTITDLASRGADKLRSATKTAFDAARSAGDGLPVSTAGLEPHVTAATDAIVRNGATADQIKNWNSVVSPMVADGPGDYVQLAGRERQLENWIGGLHAAGAAPDDIAAVQGLHEALGGQLDAAAADTGAAPLRARYTAMQSDQLPARWGLKGLEGDASNLAAQEPATIQALAKTATDPADKTALAAAWVDSARQAAAATGEPAAAMRAAYAALGPETQTALFGAQRGAFERLLQTGGQNDALGRAIIPGLLGEGGHHFGSIFAPSLMGARVALDAAGPAVAQSAIMSPAAARFGSGLSKTAGVAGPALFRVGTQATGERAEKAGLPGGPWSR